MAEGIISNGMHDSHLHFLENTWIDLRNSFARLADRVSEPGIFTENCLATIWLYGSNHISTLRQAFWDWSSGSPRVLTAIVRLQRFSIYAPCVIAYQYTCQNDIIYAPPALSSSESRIILHLSLQLASF